MAIMYCDNCKFEWDTGGIVFEELVLCEADGTKMRFFQCPECHEEYIVDITNSELRKKIAILKKMKRKYVKLYHNRASAIVLRNYGEKIENFQNEIRADERELRKRWTRAE